eukprot:4527269-Prymnesium_polylepis.3
MPEDAANAQPGVQLGVHPDAQPASMDDDAPLSPLSPLRPVPGVAQVRSEKKPSFRRDCFSYAIPHPVLRLPHTVPRLSCCSRGSPPSFSRRVLAAASQVRGSLR